MGLSHANAIEFFFFSCARRLLSDDDFGVVEPLNEQPSGKGLAVRGTHRIFMGGKKVRIRTSRQDFLNLQA